MTHDQKWRNAPKCGEDAHDGTILGRCADCGKLKED